MNVLSIKIDDINQQQALEKVEGFLQSKSKHYIVTPNPEIIMSAQEDAELKDVLNKADLSVPDGVGLKLAGIKNRVTGIDLMLDLIKLAVEKGYSVGFIGGKSGVAEKCAQVLQKRYPNLKVSFAGDGGNVDEDGVSIKYKVESRKQYKKNESGVLYTLYYIPYTDLLFVAFGAKKQEKWIARYLPEIPVKVAMTVGGSLDYVAGEVTRAPKLLRDLGLEWLFRLVIQPWRIKRQLALLKFVWLIKLS